MRRGTKTNRLVIFFIAGLILVVNAAWPGIVQAESPNDILIIANKGVPNNSVTKDELRAIFLRQRKSWTGGAKIVALHAPENSDLRVRFQKAILGMQPEDELTYWLEQQARGRDRPPVEFRKTLKAVFKLSGSISYVFREDYQEGVAKVLLVVPTH